MHTHKYTAPLSWGRLEWLHLSLLQSLDWRSLLPPWQVALMSCGEQSCTWIFRILCFGQTSVLKYIRNQTSRFKVFVANRVSEILVSQLSQWRCVDTARNSVDVASRGLKVDAFLKNVTCVGSSVSYSTRECVAC